jgi:hypothetical protein
METLNSEVISRDYRQHWGKVLNELFNFSIPSNFTWDNLDDIIKVLNALDDEQGRITMFIPGGGDIAFRRASYSAEDGFIELDPEAGFIIKPIRLAFYKIGENVEWYYFLLETKDLEKSGISDNSGPYREILAEIEPGRYSEYNASETEYMTNDQLIKPLRIISRYFSGMFAFFINTSDYNHYEDREGMQDRLSAEEFRSYVEIMHNFCKKKANV